MRPYRRSADVADEGTPWTARPVQADVDLANVPSAYAATYAAARLKDPEMADRYVAHLTRGDDVLDPVMAELASLPSRELHKFIAAGIEERNDIMRGAPQILRDFFDEVSAPPAWADFESYKPAARAFFENMTELLIAYAVGSAVEGFSTLVSKSFSITGRVTGLGLGAERRLRQNNRHMVEVYYPESFRRRNDGWKISMRIRFVHSQIRRLLAESDAWDHEAWGTPLSQAHLGGISLFTFSIRQFEHAMALGASIDAAERESVVRVWRHAGHLLGVSESILFTDEADARALYGVAHMCEPPLDADAIAVANAVFKAIPAMAGLTDEAEKRKLAMYAYRLSRALIGNDLADRLGYPPTIRSRRLVLQNYKWKQRIARTLHGSRMSKQDAFSQIFDSAQYDHEGISYRMPDHVRAAHSSPW